MSIDELNSAIESWSYIEDKLRRARNREVYGSVEWEKFDAQLASVSRHLDKLTNVLIGRLGDQASESRPVFEPQSVRFFSIEAV